MIIELEKLEKINEVIDILKDYSFPQNVINRLGEVVSRDSAQKEIDNIRRELYMLSLDLKTSSEIKGSLKTFDLPDFHEMKIVLTKEDLETILLNGGFIDLGEKAIIQKMLHKYIYNKNEEKEFIDRVEENTKTPIKTLAELDD